MKQALYVGSFDPFTLGHADIVRQAQAVFDHVHIGIGQNPRKKSLFKELQRAWMILQSAAEAGLDPDRLSVGIYDGSMMEEARSLGSTSIVRGLRQISDFGDEFTINGMVARALPNIPITYFICRQDFLHVSSSSVKEMASLGEDISWMVAPCVAEAVRNAITAMPHRSAPYQP